MNNPPPPRIAKKNLLTVVMVPAKFYVKYKVSQIVKFNLKY